ncbi:MAG: FAD-dependent pyridine nucleotide-disulfide oxidoreductase [Candidatus Aramenus sulfurataquae]|jgi:thioredoxin reductase (NADPH)|uniref:FAD-dependent oxidoreductase n=2 Tax=Candidatus Aramenus sulfurataquae TaxID=1326980 RepID=W7KMA5_9CREN|nr:MAG: FAD-dependent pyridine nucleotide-disulfide oxidoreductase [Candidatus Aramenus sulfurataquae]MCL7343276.1 FAD-dependent oxidoreductase [Candidatus Aramenus sulfurataquae]
MSNSYEEMYDVIIVGAGIAGLSAALYTSRQKLSTLVVSKDLGGQLNLTQLIENYPAINADTGIGLATKVESQAKKFGAKFIYDEEIRAISKESDYFILKGIKGDYKARAVILAFGKSPRELNVPGESELKGKGVSYCAICDAAFFKDVPAAVVGEGEPGLEAIELLSRYSKPAYYISRTPQLVGEPEVVDSVAKRKNVELYLGYIVKGIKGENKVEAIIIENLKTHETKELKVDGVIIEMGYELRTEFLKGFVKLNEKGEIIVDELGRTSVEGVFAAGDVTQTPYKQAIVASAEGVKAALSAYNYLRSLKGLPPVNVDWKAEKKKSVVTFRL